MSTATMEEVQSHLPEMIERIQHGEEIVITRAGRTVGRLVPPALPKGVPIYGRGKGKVLQLIDDDEHLKDFAEYMK